MAITKGFLRTLRNYDGQIKVFNKDKAIIELAKMINGGGEEIIIGSVWGFPEEGEPSKITGIELNFIQYNSFVFSKTEQSPSSPQDDNVLCIIGAPESDSISFLYNKIPFDTMDINYSDDGLGIRIRLIYKDKEYSVGYFR